MKILQLTKNYFPDFGGIESVTFDITEGLNAEGISCDVLCANHESRTIIENRKNYKIYRAGTLYHAFATSVSFSLISTLRAIKSNYDIIHVHFPNPMSALALFLVRPKNKLLVHWHSDIVRQKKLYRFYKPLERWVLKRADIITGTSDKYVAKSRPLDDFRNKTVTIPLGIDTERFHCDEEAVATLKKQYPGKKIVFSLGRLVYYKGFEDLIGAAKYLDDDTVVLIGGMGELEESLEKLIVENQLRDKVKLLGRVSEQELACLYTACDVFCLPSIKRSEAFGVVQLEAMLFGKPIVSTEIPGSGVSWVNQHGQTGLIVPINNPKALAAAIKNIITDRELAKRYSENALRRFNDNFTRSHMVNAYVSVYQKLLGRK